MMAETHGAKGIMISSDSTVKHLWKVRLMILLVVCGCICSVVITRSTAAAKHAPSADAFGHPISALSLVDRYASNDLTLHDSGVARWGVIKRVLYLVYFRKARSWFSQGRLKYVMGVSFTILVFETSQQAEKAVSDKPTRAALRREHTPFVRRYNVVLATQIPIAGWKSIWEKAAHVLLADP